MFVLAVVDDKIKINPDKLEQDVNQVLIEEIEAKYCNRVLLNVGLCICFYDFVEIGDGYIYPSEGAAHRKVVFRLVVFHPFVGEVLVGRVTGSNREGLRVSVGFFGDITIPAYLLQQPAEYNERERLWYWKYDPESNDFVLDIREEIRFRVRTINFAEVTASAKGKQATIISESQTNVVVANPNETEEPSAPQLRRRSSSLDLGVEEEAPAPMQIVGAINEDGLGLVSWWV